jgi:hypothetical protein
MYLGDSATLTRMLTVFLLGWLGRRAQNERNKRVRLYRDSLHRLCRFSVGQLGIISQRLIAARWVLRWNLGSIRNHSVQAAGDCCCINGN